MMSMSHERLSEIEGWASQWGTLPHGMACEVLSALRDARRTLATVEHQLALAHQAIGLATTCVPSMVLDLDHPIEMMQRVCQHLAERENREIDLGRAITGWIAANNALKQRLAEVEARAR